MRTIFDLLRARDWVKNLFVFLPIIFGGRLFSPDIVPALEVFLAFSLTASGIYTLNDLHDREHDRSHPLKCRRPIASGAVSPGIAAVLVAVLSTVGLFCCLWFHLPGATLLCVGSYVALNLLYTYLLRRFAVIDVICIAIGFVLRVMAGGAACHIRVSPWLVLMVFMLTLFIAFGKRRDDLIRMDSDSVKPRESAAAYTLTFIDMAMGVLGASLIVAYCIYTLSPEVTERYATDCLYLTSLFVITGLLRYMQLALIRMKSGDPTAIFCKDPIIIGCCILWLGSFIVIIYGKKFGLPN